MYVIENMEKGGRELTEVKWPTTINIMLSASCPVGPCEKKSKHRKW